MVSKIKSTVSYENVTCGNCNTKFNGRFCPECGQAVKEYDKPLSFLFYNFTGDFFSFDVRFLMTLKYLIFRPGFLTKEYFEGRRVRYAPPLRVFIFLSFILFLLLQFYTDRGLNRTLDKPINEIGINTSKDSIVSKNQEISFILNKGFSADNQKEIIKFDMETFKDTRNLRDMLKKTAVALEKELEKETNPNKREKLENLIRVCHNPELATSTVLKYMSWTFFFLLPVFALILKLFYIRQNHYYMRHLIFSIHFHSFVFIAFTCVTFLYLVWAEMGQWVSLIILLTVPIYFALALKKFYGQKTGTVVLKFLSISVLYNSMFWLLTGIVFAKSLGII